MEVQQFLHLFLSFARIFVCFFPFVYSGAPGIHLESTVFVAFANANLNIACNLNITANQSSSILTCSDPFNKQIYNCVVSGTTEQPKNVTLTLELKNLKSSGEYSCRYKTAEVYWFLRVRDDGYKDHTVVDYRSQLIIAAVFCVVLLMLSVVGSVFVFRGHWKECIRKQKKNKEERKDRERTDSNVDIISAPSTSFYASLEPRPRSIYDVLDCSVAKAVPDQHEAKPKKKVPQKKMVQNQQPQLEDVFESVYENF